MVTLKEIAREAGVSITTVSNVVNNNVGRVSPENQQKIREIIKRMNYVPNMTARTPANNVSPIIGIINHSVPQDMFLADPFHNAFMGSIEARSREKNYYLMVRTVEDAKDLEALHRNWNLTGFIFTGLFRDEFFEGVQKLGVPFVLIDSYCSPN